MARTSAGRCHGCLCFCHSGPGHLSAAPGVIAQLSFRGQRAVAWHCAGIEAGMMLGRLVGVHMGTWGPRPLPQGLFLTDPQRAGQGGHAGALPKLSLLARRGMWAQQTQRASGAGVPSAWLLHCLSPGCRRQRRFALPSLPAFALGHWRGSELPPELWSPGTGSVAAELSGSAPLPGPATHSGCSPLSFLLFCWFPSCALPPRPRRSPARRGPGARTRCAECAAEAVNPHPAHPSSDTPCST